MFLVLIEDPEIPGHIYIIPLVVLPINFVDTSLFHHTVQDADRKTFKWWSLMRDLYVTGSRSSRGTFEVYYVLNTGRQISTRLETEHHQKLIF